MRTALIGKTKKNVRVLNVFKHHLLAEKTILDEGKSAIRGVTNTRNEKCN